MKKISFSVACCMLVVTVLFNSCAKTGPAGSTGATGATGAAGSAGPAGVPGAPGTANVIYSEWLDVKYVYDTVHTGTKIDTVGTHADIPAAKMTLDILTKGEIKVYWNRGTVAAPAVFPLPYFDGGDILNPYFTLQRIRILATDDFGTFTSTSGKTFQYRYILIPGAVTGRSIVNWNNYVDVKKYLNLQD